MHAPLQPVDDASEPVARAQGPHHGERGHAKLVLNLLEELKRLERRPIELVHECEDGQVAKATHLEEFVRLQAGRRQESARVREHANVGARRGATEHARVRGAQGRP